jgi:hypothetical protein
MSKQPLAKLPFNFVLYQPPIYNKELVSEFFLKVVEGNIIEIKKFIVNNNIPAYVIDTETGETALHKVIKSEKILQDVKLEIIEYLIRNGAHVIAFDKTNTTPLHLACKYRLLQIAKLLIVNGADVDIADNSGMTPLHYAIRGNIIECEKEEPIEIEKKEKTSKEFDDLTKLIVEKITENSDKLNLLLDLLDKPQEMFYDIFEDIKIQFEEEKSKKINPEETLTDLERANIETELVRKFSKIYGEKIITELKGALDKPFDIRTGFKEGWDVRNEREELKKIAGIKEEVISYQQLEKKKTIIPKNVPLQFVRDDAKFRINILLIVLFGDQDETISNIEMTYLCDKIHLLNLMSCFFSSVDIVFTDKFIFKQMVSIESNKFKRLFEPIVYEENGEWMVSGYDGITFYQGNEKITNKNINGSLIIIYHSMGNYNLFVKNEDKKGKTHFEFLKIENIKKIKSFNFTISGNICKYIKQLNFMNLAICQDENSLKSNILSLLPTLNDTQKRQLIEIVCIEPILRKRFNIPPNKPIPKLTNSIGTSKFLEEVLIPTEDPVEPPEVGAPPALPPPPPVEGAPPAPPSGESAEGAPPPAAASGE